MHLACLHACLLHGCLLSAAAAWAREYRPCTVPRLPASLRGKPCVARHRVSRESRRPGSPAQLVIERSGLPCASKETTTPGPNRLDLRMRAGHDRPPLFGRCRTGISVCIAMPLSFPNSHPRETFRPVLLDVACSRLDPPSVRLLREPRGFWREPAWRSSCTTRSREGR